MTIFGASIGLNMCFFRQTLLSVCLVVPFSVWGQTVAGDDTANTLEDNDISFSIIGNDSGGAFALDLNSIDLQPGSTGTIENSFSIPDVGDFSVDATGEVTFSPVQDFFGDATASYTIKNLNPTPETSSEATITVTVSAVNDLPTFTPIDNQVIDEDSPTGVIAFTVDDAEIDPEDIAVTGSSSDQALIQDSNIDLQELSGGNWTVQITPNPNLNGSATITLTVSDGDETAPLIFLVTVNAVNDVPVFTGGADQTNVEDAGAQSVSNWSTGISDGDPELDQVLTFDVTNGNNALFSVQPAISATGELTYTLAPDISGSALVTVSLSDDGSGVAPNVNTSADQTFTITVTAVNDAPVFTTGPDQTVSENAGAQSVAGWATGIDDGDPEIQILTFNVTNDNNSLFSAQPSITPTGTLSFTPAPGINGSAVVTVSLSDDGSGVAPNVNTSPDQTFTINVTAAVNDAPVFTKGPDQTVSENAGAQTVAGWATGIDDGDPELSQTLTFNVTNDNNSLFSAQPSITPTGTLSFTPAPGMSGSSVVTVSLSDDGSGVAPNVNTSPQQTFNITVTLINNAPLFTKGADQTDNEDDGAQSISNWATAIDDGDPEEAQTVTFNVSNNNNGLFNVQPAISATGTLTYTPAPNANGPAVVTVSLSDSGSDVPPNENTSTAQTFNITINAVNDAPVFVEGSDVTVSENAGPQSVPGWATGIVDGDPEVSQTLTFNVSNNNNALFSVQPSITNGGTLSFTTAPGANGSAVVSVSLSDNGSGIAPNVNNSAQQTFNITVTPVNDPPTITSILDQTIPEDSQTGPLAFTIGDDETPIADLRLTPTSSNLGLVPNNQVMLIGAGSMRNVNVIPLINQIGQTTITLELSDGSLSSTTSFNVMVTALDDPPTITPIGDQVINEDSQTGLIAFTVDDLETPGAIMVTATSSDQALIQNSDIDLQDLGGGDWTVQITPNPNQNGVATITIAVEAGGETTPLDFLVTVNAVNDVPAFAGGADQTDTEDAGPQSVSNWATGVSDGDPELNQALTFNVSNGNPTLFSAQPAISAAGVLTYTPAANISGSALVTVSLSDDGSGAAPNVNTSASQTFTINVTAVNDAPVFTKGADQTVVENDGAQSVPGWATGIDDGDPDVVQTMTFSVSNDNNSLFSAQPAITPTGTLSFTPAAGTSGSAVVTVSVSDNGSGVSPNVNTSPQQTFNITVTAINSAPLFTKGPDQTDNEDDGAQSISNWATAIGDGDPDEVQTLTFNVSNDNNALFSVQPAISATGTLTYTPAANANGSTVVTVTLSDSGSDVPPNENTSAAQTFNITINAVNDAPVFVGGSDVTVNENAGAQSVPGWATGMTDGDPEANQTLSFNVTNDNNGLFTVQPVLTAGGNLSFTPAAGVSGSTTVTVSLSDNGSGAAPNVNTSGPQTFTITVTSINDAPVFTKGPDQTIGEDSGPQTVNGWATGISDSDPETQALTFNVSNDNNTLFSAQPAITAAGNLSYTPAANASGSTTVTVTLSDDGPGSPPNVNTSGPQTFTILINGVNDAPTVSAIGPQTINEDAQTGNIGFTISDPETAAVDLDVTATSDNTTLVPNNVANIVLGGAGPSRTINIIPVANLSGSATITINVSDGTLSTPRNFLVTVTAVNDPPTITAITDQTVTEDNPTGSLAFTIGDTETPIGSLSLTRSSSNTILVPVANVVLGGSGASRTVIVTPAQDQTGTTTITITVDDGTTTTSEEFVVNVTPINDPPTISAISDRTINEDTQTGNINFTISDPETAATALEVTGSSSDTGLVPNANIILGGTGTARTVNIIPALNQTGATTITLNVSDGLISTPITFQVNVTPVNDGPQITNQIPVTINEGESVTLTVAMLTIIDPDNVYPTDFTLAVTGGTGYSVQGAATITPNTNVSGVLSVPVYVSDGAAISPIFQFQITVNSTNDAPQITGQEAITIQEDQNYSIQFDDLTVIDPDNTNYPTGFTMEILAGTNYTFSGQTVTPTPNFNGSLSVNVRVNDGQANSNIFPLVITVSPVNDPPAITNQSPLSTNEETELTLVIGNFTVTDPEPTAYTLTVLPSSSPDYTVAPGNKITPSLDFTGTLSVPVTVSDGALISAQYSAQITVNPVNDPPLILNLIESLATVEDIPITLALSDLNVSDVDNSYPTGFTLIIEAGPNYTFSGTTVTPATDFVGQLSVVVRVNDGVANSPQFTALIEVTDDADAPIINGQNPVAIEEDGSREIILTDLDYDDPDTDPAQLIVLVQPGTNYTLEGNTVIPLPNFFGTLTVPVRINDGEANSNLFQMQVTVNAVNDNPSFNQPADRTINEDAAQQSLTITGISAGPLESQTLLLLVTSDRPDLIPDPVQTPTYNGTAPTATLTFRPEPNMYGVVTITVRVIDPGPQEVVKTFTITISPVNDAPTLQPIPAVSMIEDEAERLITLTGISAGGQESNQTLKAFVSNIDKPELVEAIGEIDIAAPNGTLRIKPRPNAHGTAQVTVRVEDDGPGSPPPNVNFILRTFTVTIESVNDLVDFTTTPGYFAEPGTLYTYNVEAVDNDGDVITLTAPARPAWLTLTQVGNGKATLSGTPPPGPGGLVEVVLEVTDPTGPPRQDPFTITVNSRPVLTPITVTTSEDMAHTFSAAEFAEGFDDADGNPLAELEITDLPKTGTLTYNNNLITVGTKISFADISKLVYTPATDSTGQDTLRWNASDGFNMYSANDSYVLLNVTPINDLPIINIPESDVAETDTLKYELGSEIPVFVSSLFEAKDPDGDNITGATIGFKSIDNFVYRSENDRLIFEGTSKITGTFDEGSGRLDLNGVATAQEYVEAIRSIKYNYEDTRELLLDTRSVYVSLSDGQGTSLQESRIITLVYTFSDLDIPTAFTPNGDDANETWKITAANGTAQYDEAEVKVYNKRGLLLFETKGFEQQWNGVWNGETLPSDTYFYTIELNYNKVRYKGTVTILR